MHARSQALIEVVEEVRVRVDGHQVEADIAFLDLHGAEEERLLIGHDVQGVQGEVLRFVSGDDELTGEGC